MGRLALNILTVLIFVGTLVFSYNLYTNMDISVVQDKYSVVREKEPGDFKVESENSITCDDKTFKYILTCMQNDGVELSVVETEDDVNVLGNNTLTGVKYNMMFSKTGYFISIASQYEKSSDFMTYITKEAN